MYQENHTTVITPCMHVHLSDTQPIIVKACASYCEILHSIMPWLEVNCSFVAVMWPAAKYEETLMMHSVFLDHSSS